MGRDNKNVRRKKLIALVTGASSGIGRDIARELAKRSYNLIVVARNEDALKDVKSNLEKEYNINVDIRVVDLIDREGCKKLHEDIQKKYGIIDVLVNNAGFGDCGNFYETNLEKDLGIIDTNISALHILTKLFLKDMVKENKGYIMNVASIAGFMPGPLMATYYAGFGDCGNFYETNLEKDLGIIDTNISALHILTKLFLKDMVKENKGYIMNVASIAGFMPGPLMATYYATKSYVVRLTQSIDRELKMKKSNVKVSVLCPGPVKTNFQRVADVKFNITETKSEDVARIAVKKMFKGKKVIFTQFHIAFTKFLAKILPDSFMGFCCYFVQKRKL